MSAAAVSWPPTALPERVSDKITVNLLTGCWLWTAGTNRGYGQAGWHRPDGSRSTASAHRVVYHLLADPGLPVFPGRGGSVPVADHLCRVRRCVNPAHLRIVTQRRNVLAGDLTNGGSSRYPGVYWHRGVGRWQTRIRRDGRQHSLGYYDNETAAFSAYLAALEPVDPAAYAELVAEFGDPGPAPQRRPSTSSYPGVSRWRQRDRPWRAGLYHDGRARYLGSYDSEEEAYRAYLDGVAEHAPHRLAGIVEKHGDPRLVEVTQ